MITALHNYNVVTLGLGSRHFDRSFDRLTARIPEEEAVQARIRHHREERFDELDVRLRQGDGALYVDDRLSLCNDCRGNGGVSMPERGHTDTGREVKKLSSILRVSQIKNSLTLVKTRKPLPSLKT